MAQLNSGLKGPHQTSLTNDQLLSPPLPSPYDPALPGFAAISSRLSELELLLPNLHPIQSSSNNKGIVALVFPSLYQSS